MKIKKSWGVEIEGGFRRWRDVFTETQQNRLMPHIELWHMGHDTSVSIRGASYTEVQSKPTTRTAILSSFKYLYRLITDTNNSCGTHIHVGVHRKYYGVLCTPEYVSFFTEKYTEKWGYNPKYMQRTSNRYCSPHIGVSDIAAQLWVKTSRNYHSESRYKAVNFPFNKHGTVEHRIFPHLSCQSGTYHTARQELKEMMDFVDKTIDAFLVGKEINIKMKETIQIPTRGKEEVIYV